MRKTRKAKRKPHGTLRKSRRYRRGGYALKRSNSRLDSWAASVRVGGKRRKSKRRSSRKKRGGNLTTNQQRLSPQRLSPQNVS